MLESDITITESLRIYILANTRPLTTGPQQSGKRQRHEGHSSGSSSNKDVQDNGREQKKRQGEEMSTTQPKLDITSGPVKLYLLTSGTTKNAPLGLINVYTPVIKSKQLAILPQLPLLLATSRPVILAGDFNCIIDVARRSRVTNSKLDATSRFPMETVKDAKLHDVFSTHTDRTQPGGTIRTGIDFLFVTQMFLARSTDVKPVFFSDHCFLLADSHLQDFQRTGEGTWKLNMKLLTPEHIEEVKRYYEDLEYLTVKCHRYYLLHEFPSAILTAVYIPPYAEVKSAFEEVYNSTNSLETEYPEALFIIHDRSTADAISLVLLSFPEHLVNKDTSIRLLFIDYSSAFNTIIPNKFISKFWGGIEAGQH
eukprot:g41245.t1